MNNSLLSNSYDEILDSPPDMAGADKLQLANDEITNDSLQVTNDDVLSATHDVTGNTFGDIQTAINTAAAGDTIYLGGKTFTASGSAIIVNKDLIICGGSSDNPSGFSTLNGNGNNNNPIFQLTSSGITLMNIEFTKGQSNVGAAIQTSSDASNIVFENCNFTNNEAIWNSKYATAYLQGSNTKFRNCNFENNLQGAIYSTTNIIIEDSSFSGVNGVYPAIFAEGSVNIVNSKFMNNVRTSWDNGAALVIQGSNSRIINSNFTGNKAQNKEGGAIYATGSGLNISGCIFADNSASGGGNDIYSTGANGIISNSSFQGDFVRQEVSLSSF